MAIHKVILAEIIFAIALIIIGFTMEFLGITKEEGNFIGFAGILALIISLNVPILVKELERTREVVLKGERN
jgi:hypothetical protein